MTLSWFIMSEGEAQWDADCEERVRECRLLDDCGNERQGHPCLFFCEVLYYYRMVLFLDIVEVLQEPGYQHFAINTTVKVSWSRGLKHNPSKILSISGFISSGEWKVEKYKQNTNQNLYKHLIIFRFGIPTIGATISIRTSYKLQKKKLNTQHTEMKVWRK